MGDPVLFLKELFSEFKQLERMIRVLLKDEKRTENDTLVQHGFLIKHYSLNVARLNTNEIDALDMELKRISQRESHLLEQLWVHRDEIAEVAQDLKRFQGRGFQAGLLERELKEVFHYTNLLIRRIEQLRPKLEKHGRLHKKIAEESEFFFASFENICNKIVRFVHILEQLTARLSRFEEKLYYPEPRTYGRAMSHQEYEATLETHHLASGKEPTPVFDAPRAVVGRLEHMPSDQLKTFFAAVGVVALAHLVFFRTRRKPINHERPIPQSNGLREYKFHRGMKIKIVGRL